MQYRPHNITFDMYLGHSLEESEAREFINRKNQEKGGTWELYTEQQFESVANPNCMPEKCTGDYDILNYNGINHRYNLRCHNRLCIFRAYNWD